jgi:hypothetical protein
VLKGGGAGDAIDGGAGDDAIDGGPGFDIADYAGSVLPVSIDLAATGPQDGGSMGRDTLASIEYVGGGEADDLLRGTAAKELLDGGLGDDVLEGRGGDDHLFGDLGSDTASYASAAGPVTVDPGAIDAVTGCETVVAGVAAGLPGAPSAGTPAAARRRVRATINGAATQRLSRAGVAVRLRCAALACSARAAGTVSVRIGSRVRRLSLISRRIRLAAGRSALVRLGLTPRSRALVAAALVARRPAFARVRVAVTDASAATATLRRTIRLVR